MIAAVFKIMWLRLWRDKGALLLAFILPGIIFAVFAAIFSSASGGALDLRVAISNESPAPASLTYFDALRKDSSFSVSYDPEWGEAEIRQRVRLGQDDVGVVIKGDVAAQGAAPFLIIKDPSRDVAATVIKGQLRQRLAAQSGINAPDLFLEESALPEDKTDSVQDQSVTYYIGATAILFLLFSAMQGASLSIEERRSGLSERLMVGPMGALNLLTGKFLFLTLIGFVQAWVIVIVAWLAFSVPITAHIGPLMLACLGSAMLAAAIGLLVASLCTSQPQMHAVSTFLVLLLSAIGGSMVPRFMMPSWLQDIGQFTPNFWSIDAFYGILARGQSASELWLCWTVLFGGALLAFLLAAIISHRLRRT